MDLYDNKKVGIEFLGLKDDVLIAHLLKDGKLPLDDPETIKKIKEELLRHNFPNITDRAHLQQLLDDSVNKNKNKNNNNTNENTLENMNNFCNIFLFNKDNPNQYDKAKQASNQVFYDETDSTVPSGSYQYIIGRFATLQKVSGLVNKKALKNPNATESPSAYLFNNLRIRILQLDENDKNRTNWSMVLNDLFLYCANIHDTVISNESFSVRLVYEDDLCKNSLNNQNYDLAKRVCIDTAAKLQYEMDTITLKEIVLLGVVFGLKCYLYQGETSYSKDENNQPTGILTYFFTRHSIDNELYKEVNIPTIEQLYQYKYLKYRTKYLALKNKLINK